MICFPRLLTDDKGPDLPSVLSAATLTSRLLVILMQAHSAFDLDALASHAQAFLDT